MTRKEAMRQTMQADTLHALGFTPEEAEALRRISMTLRRWFELECGTGNGQTSISIERDGDEPDSKPYKRIQYPTAQGYVDHRYPVADRERGAMNRLKAIMAKHPTLSYYIQSDPRGAALYILRPGDVPEGADAGSYYNRGICVY